jgi:hypothetical protein
VPAVTAVFALLIAGLMARRRKLARRPARTLIISPSKSTLVAQDGGVRSVQTARLTLSSGDLDRLWTPANLEDLGRTYWRFLSKVTLGMIRVVYSEHDRAVVLLRCITLLRFAPPAYELERCRGRIMWRIKDGLLVARGGRGCGWLSLEVRREDPGDAAQPAGAAGAAGAANGGGELAHLTIEVEVANFYPSIAAGVSTFVYETTQAFVHVLVTHAFLRSLATLQLAESTVRRFPVEPTTPDQSSERR